MIIYTITNAFADVKGIATLLEQLTPTDGELEQKALYKAAYRIFMNEDYTVWIARDYNTKRIIGTAMLRIEYKLSHKGVPSAHIEDVVVDYEYRKQGIATELIKQIIETAKKTGCYKVTLNCFEAKKPFYEKLGFRNHDIGMRIDLPTERAP